MELNYDNVIENLLVEIPEFAKDRCKEADHIPDEQFIYFTKFLVDHMSKEFEYQDLINRSFNFINRVEEDASNENGLRSIIDNFYIAIIHFGTKCVEVAKGKLSKNSLDRLRYFSNFHAPPPQDL